MQASSFQFKIEELSPVEKSLSFEVSPPYVKQKLDAAYQKATRDTEIPGFRKGKAPRQLVEQHYGRQIESDVFADIFEETFYNCVEKEQLELAARPILETRSPITISTPLTYQVRVEVYPKVIVHTYQGLSAQKRTASVTDADIDKQLEQLRERSMEMKPIEGRDTLQSSDVVTLQIEGYVNGKHYSEKSLWVDLAKPEESALSGLAEHLIGLPITAKDHALSFLPNTGKENESGSPQKTEVKVSVLSAHEKHLPPLDDDFAKDNGDADNLLELRENLRSSLLKRDEKRAKREMEEQLVLALVERNPVPLPPSLIDEVTKDYLENRRYEILLKLIEKKTSGQQMGPELVKETAESMAKRDLAFQFLVKEIAKENHFVVTDEQLEAYLAEWAQAEGTSVPRLKSKLEREQFGLTNIRAQLLTEKVLALIESSANTQTEA